MSFEHLIAGIISALVVDHYEAKKKRKAMQEECSCIDTSYSQLESHSLKQQTEEPPVEGGESWREEYRDNLAGLNPEEYDTLEQFLWVYEAQMGALHKEFMKVVLTQLTELTERYDLRFAAAIVYCGFRSHLDSKNFMCAEKCLSEVVERNGVRLETVVSIADQLEEAIKSYEDNPDTQQEFKISLL